MAVSNPTERRPVYWSRSEDYEFTGRKSPIFDTLFVFLPITALLFNPVIGLVAILLILATVESYLALRYDRMPALLGRRWRLLLLPLFCLALVQWFEAPANTLRYGTLYLVIVFLAIIIGGGTLRLNPLKAMQLVFSLYLLRSIIFGKSTVIMDGSYAFLGLANSKSAAADTEGVALLVSTATFLWAVQRQMLVWAGIGILSIFFAASSLLIAKSTGATLATAAVLGCLILWSFSRQVSKAIRIFIFAVAVVATTALLATTPLWMDAGFESLLESSRKDRTITGPTDLWRVAEQYIAARPLLGVGYGAFWVPENLDAIALWELVGIPTVNPFNFNNTPRGLVVATGMAGLALYAVVWIGCIAALLLKTMRAPDYFSIFCCAIVVFIAPWLYFEELGIASANTLTVLIFAVCACGLRSTLMRGANTLFVAFSDENQRRSIGTNV